MTPVVVAAVFVALAGAGTLARSGIQGIAHQAGFWPAGTFVVNLAGSFAVGLLAGAAGDDLSSPATLAAAAAIGGLGAFTTFSSFAHELGILLTRQRWLMAGTYGVATMVGGVTLAWMGLSITS
jgi:CrcB protein